MPSNVEIESWKFSRREPISPSIGMLKTRVLTLPEKLRNLAASIRVQEDLSMELDSLAHVAETLLTPKPSEAHQIDALTERVEIAERNQWPCGERPNPCVGYSCDGVNVYGDEKSMRAVRDAFHAQGTISELRGLLAQYKTELKSQQDDIEDWRLRHQNLSKKYSELSWMYQELSR